MPFASRSNGFYVSASLATVYALCSGVAWRFVLQLVGTVDNDVADDSGFVILTIVAAAFGLLAIAAGVVAYQLRVPLPPPVPNLHNILG